MSWSRGWTGRPSHDPRRDRAAPAEAPPMASLPVPSDSALAGSVGPGRRPPARRGRSTPRRPPACTCGTSTSVSGYERQVDSRTCTAASIAMMANFITHRDLRLDQLAILRYVAGARRPRTTASSAGRTRSGWARGRDGRHRRGCASPTTYDWAGLRFRAVGPVCRGMEHRALRQARRPADEARQARGGHDRLRGHRRPDAFVRLDPPRGLRERPARLPAYSLCPRGSAPLDQYRELDAAPSYDTQWYGRWVVVIPRS